MLCVFKLQFLFLNIRVVVCFQAVMLYVQFLVATCTSLIEICTVHVHHLTVLSFWPACIYMYMYMYMHVSV